MQDIFYKDNRSKVVCFCCGFPGHTKPNCKYKTLTFTNCKKVGHLKKVCKAKTSVNSVEKVNDDFNLNCLFNMESVEVNFINPYVIKLKIREVNINF